MLTSLVDPPHFHKPTSGSKEHRDTTERYIERILIQRILNDDPRAIQEFENRYRNLIHATLHRCRVCAQDHDDIYQEVYARLWAQKLRRLKLWHARGTGAFSSYLTAVVRNLISDWYRHRATRQFANDSLDSAGNAVWGPASPMICSEEMMIVDFDARLLHEERISAVRQAMEILHSRDADLIRRRYYAEQSYQEIAETLGMSVNNVGVALSNARLRLRRHLCRLQPDLFVA